MIDNGLDRLWIISPHTYVIFVKFTQPLLIDFWITSWTPGFSAASISRWCNVCIIAVEIINLSSEPCALQWRGWLAQPWWTWWFISAWDYMHIWFINFDSAAFWLGCVRMSQRFIKKSSYCEPCVNEWKTNHTLCMLATKCKQLVRDAAQGKIVYPTLQNIRFNHALLKAYTKTMAERGVITTNRMSYIKPPVRDFFELMEIDCKTDATITAIHASAFVIKINVICNQKEVEKMGAS